MKHGNSGSCDARGLPVKVCEAMRVGLLAEKGRRVRRRAMRYGDAVSSDSRQQYLSQQ